jgi:hypothetical protein
MDVNLSLLAVVSRHTSEKSLLCRYVCITHRDSKRVPLEYKCYIALLGYLKEINILLLHYGLWCSLRRSALSYVFSRSRTIDKLGIR